MNPSIARRSNWESWFNAVLTDVQVTVLITRRKKPNRTPTSSTLCLMLATSVACCLVSPPIPNTHVPPTSTWPPQKKETNHKGSHLKVSRLLGRCILHPYPTQIHSLFSQSRKNNHFSLEEAQLLQIPSTRNSSEKTELAQFLIRSISETRTVGMADL